MSRYMIVDTVVLVGDDRSDVVSFAEAITKLINDGWNIAGGISTCYFEALRTVEGKQVMSKFIMYNQAMTRE